MASLGDIFRNIGTSAKAAAKEVDVGQLLGAAMLLGAPMGMARAGAAPSVDAIDHKIEQRMPSGGMEVDYQVNYVPGQPQFNARLNRSLGEAAFMQSEKEHNDALTYYLKRLPKTATRAQMNEAIRKGIMRERKLKKFWEGNRTLRDYISPSSSAASSIKIRPDNNIEVTFGNNPKRYTYRGGSNPYEAAQEAAKLALSGSIGQALNKYNPTSWGATHKLF